MPNYSRFYDGDMDDLATVVAFDPGETTGFCVMGIVPSILIRPPGGKTGYEALHQCLAHVEYGEIDCGAKHGQTGHGVKRGHEGLNMAGENNGIQHMVNLTSEYGSAAVVLEDFIPDPEKFDQARHTLSPVRIIAALSYGMWMEWDRFGQGIRNYEERIFVQNRSLHKTTFTDERLRNLGLYDSHSGPHARDATRAAFYFIRDCRGKGMDAAEKRHLAWPHLFDDPMAEVGLKPKRPKKIGERVNIK